VKNLKQYLFAVGIFIITGSANAVSITGSIGFTGTYIHNGSTLADATAIISTSSVEVTGVVTGSFADEGIADGTAATYSGFTFNPTGPVADLWSVGSFTFDLTSMVVEFQSSSTLLMSGSGVVSSTDANLEDSFMEWTFSANQAGGNLNSSSSAEAAVPVPAAVWLFGSGLLGLVGVARGRKNA